MTSFVIRHGDIQGEGRFLSRIRRTAPDSTAPDGAKRIHATMLWADTSPLIFDTIEEATAICLAMTKYCEEPIVCHIDKKRGPVVYGKVPT